MALTDIDHIVFVMLENRSFDHMLGYLSLDGPRRNAAVEGLRSDKAWRDGWINLGDGKPYGLNPLAAKKEIADPPHGSVRIRQQIATPTAGGAQPHMGGFVQSYVDSRRTDPHTGLPLKKPKTVKNPGAVMGYYEAEDVPTFDFFARNFCVCDNWFTPLPLGTQANRLMALCGHSKLIDNDTLGFPDQDDLVYDWLKGVGWRGYFYGGFVPFITLMPRMRKVVAKSFAGKGPFKRFKRLASDWKNDKDMPPVIFIEPEYSDGPGQDPNDDHPPTGVGGGQDLLNRVYQILVSNPARWAKTLMIVTYDEHGGFFDHVPPLPLRTIVGEGPEQVEFGTTGPRVPALLVSPFVEPGQVFKEPVDHTSFLHLLAERFTPGKGYSDAVTQRQKALGGRLANALRPPRNGPAPKLDLLETKGITVGRAVRAWNRGAGYWAPDTPNGWAYDDAVRKLVAEHPEVLAGDDTGDIAEHLTHARPARTGFDHIQ